MFMYGMICSLLTFIQACFHSLRSVTEVVHALISAGFHIHIHIHVCNDQFIQKVYLCYMLDALSPEIIICYPMNPLLQQSKLNNLEI